METVIFDPALGYAPFRDPEAVTDSTVAKRGNRWWMYLAGKVTGREGIVLMSASLPEGAPLAMEGWRLTADAADPTRVGMLAPQERSASWDLKGGRHCPAYVAAPGVERIYYAGGAQNLWGPYTIGYLEWDGAKWVDQPEPVFRATEAWERGSVYEPNVIFDEGVWKMWYVAGSNGENYLAHGYAESKDGVSWGEHRPFAAPEEKIFDFHVRKTARGYEAVFSRVWMGPGEAPKGTGLNRVRADRAYATLAGWGAAESLTGPGPWKPSVAEESGKTIVFFDRARDSYVFSLCALELPE